MTHHVAFVLHPGFQLLDVSGPLAALEIANRFRPDHYAIALLAPGGGSVPSSAGIALQARPLARRRVDTVIVSGGEITRSMAAVHAIVAWLKTQRSPRIASVCSGAYLLAQAGLLDGRCATTHWNSTEDFARRYPQVKLQPERILARDGPVWTSAGITAGIDLALALIEADLGASVARLTAQQLVVHQRRPGGQSQFSSLVDLGGRTGRFADLIAWMSRHLAKPLTVERLAEHAAMSPRHFARAFVAETGLTPAKAVERLRLDTARRAVETSPTPFERIAEATGFGDAGRMRRAFLRQLGQPPQALRRSARRET